MTARQVLEAVLIEMNKVNAPSLLLEDFNYLFNKAINQYINKRYNVYDVNQQTTDDIRVLKSTAVLKPTRMMDGASAYGEGLDSGNVVALNALYGATYEVNLPADYLHILNCICIYQVHNTVKCYNAGSFQSFAAKRLTSDSWPIVLNNWYQRPSYRRPYYFLHNVNAKNDMTASNSTLRHSVFGDSIPTDPYTAPTGSDDKSIFGAGADYNATQWLYSKKIQEKIDSVNNTTSTPVEVGAIGLTITGTALSSPVTIAADSNENNENYDIFYTLDGSVPYVFDDSNEESPTNCFSGQNSVTISTARLALYAKDGSVTVRAIATNDNKLTSIATKVISNNGTTNSYIRLNELNILCKYASSTAPIPLQFAIVYIKDNGDAAINWVAYLGEYKTGNLEATISGSVQYIVKEKDNQTFNPNDTTTYEVIPVTNFARTINLANGVEVDAVEKPAAVRLGNVSPVRLEVRYGRDDSVFELKLVHVDYIKTPQYIRLTHEQLDLTVDTSQIMEFPDYVCQEIINELVHIVMENASDPRLANHVAVSQSVAGAQQLAAQASAE